MWLQSEGWKAWGQEGASASVQVQKQKNAMYQSEIF